MEQWKFQDPPNVAVIASRKIVHGGDWIAHVSHDASDGGWQFHNEEPLNEDNAAMVSLRNIVLLDPSVIELSGLPLRWRAWRESDISPWKRMKID
jgi:hypothetical protein